jgi:hypothetical protein
MQLETFDEVMWDHGWSESMTIPPRDEEGLLAVTKLTKSNTAWGEWHIVSTREFLGDTQYLWRRLLVRR